MMLLHKEAQWTVGTSEHCWNKDVQVRIIQISQHSTTSTGYYLQTTVEVTKAIHSNSFPQGTHSHRDEKDMIFAAAKSLPLVSNSVRPHRWQPTSLPRPWDSPGKNIGVGCHFPQKYAQLYLLNDFLCHISICYLIGFCSNLHYFHTWYVCVSHSVVSNSLKPHGL